MVKGSVVDVSSVTSVVEVSPSVVEVSSAAVVAAADADAVVRAADVVVASALVDWSVDVVANALAVSAAHVVDGPVSSDDDVSTSDIDVACSKSGEIGVAVITGLSDLDVDMLVAVARVVSTPVAGV